MPSKKELEASFNMGGQTHGTGGSPSAATASVSAPRAPKGPKAEFIDHADPEWAPFIGESHDLSGLTESGNETATGNIRFDKEDGNFTLIIAGGSCNFVAEQHEPLKAAVKAALKSWPKSTERIDLGHGGILKVLKGHRVPNSEDDLGDEKPKEDLLVVRCAGLVRMVKAQAEKLLAVL